jgi:hypothetical protein
MPRERTAGDGDPAAWSFGGDVIGAGNAALNIAGRRGQGHSRDGRGLGGGTGHVAQF